MDQKVAPGAGPERPSRTAEFVFGVLDALPAGIVLLDAEGRIVSANAGWKDFCAALPPKLAALGREGSDYFAAVAAATPAHAEMLREGITAVLRGESPQFRHEVDVNGDGDTRWFLVCANPLPGPATPVVVTHFEITMRKGVEAALRREKEEQEKLVAQLKQAQAQLLQSEKMASIGQLAAGVAHEINNPVGYISSNINSLRGYIDDLFQMLESYQAAEAHIADEQVRAEIQALRERLDLDFVKGDVRALIDESEEGVRRVRQIVQDLKDFSHVDEAEWQWADLHQGIESTLNIVWNELKYKAEVKKEYGDLPEVECIPSQINQVFMNLLINAAHAIEQKGCITIRTGTLEGGEWVWIEISDTGCGIPPEQIGRIFEPFFTTKPVGQGTGLGLSLSYGIVEKHNGRLTVDSEVGRGTTFRIELPVHHEEPKAEPALPE